MSVAKLPHYTYEDYKLWEGDWELIDGIPFAMAPSPMITHQSIATELLFAFRDELEECEECKVLGEVDWKISDDTVVRPDLVLTCGEESKTYLLKTPKVVVEIVSPSTAKKDERYKFDIYEEEKVLYYILIYPDDLKAKIYKLKKGRFDKEGDFFSQKYKFEDVECEVEVDFEKVFKRFRKL